MGSPPWRRQQQDLHLRYLADAGPRIVRVPRSTSEVSLLAEAPDALKETRVRRHRFTGGHRLRHSKEAVTRAYLPDEPVGVQVQPNDVRLIVSAESGGRIANTINVRLDHDRPAATVRHKLR